MGVYMGDDQEQPSVDARSRNAKQLSVAASGGPAVSERTGGVGVRMPNRMGCAELDTPYLGGGSIIGKH